MSPIISAISGATVRGYGHMVNVVRSIKDSFARVTSGSLGTADSGQVWTAVNGVWYANSGVATTATAASSYPLATVPFKTSVNMTAQSTSQGAGLAFWQTDAGDWWALTPNSNTSSYITGYTCTSFSCTGYICTGYSSSCNGYTSSCTGGTYSFFYGYNTLYGCNGTSSVCSGYSSYCSSSACNGYTCAGYTANYGTQYNFYISIWRMLSNAFSQVTSYTVGNNTTNTAMVNSIQLVVTSTGSITGTAFSDSANVTSVGTVTTTATPPAASVNAGIVLVPSTNSQGSTIGPINAI